MDDQFFDYTLTTHYYQRLKDPFPAGNYSGETWWFVLVPVLALAAFFICWMYIKDTRSIRWYFALPLGLMRCTVYGFLTYMFLLPTEEEVKIRNPRVPPPLVKTSRVVVLIDVSDSMARVSDDPRGPKGFIPTTRLQKVVEYISDSNAAFMNKLLAENPVYFYRFASRLDNEVYSFRNVEITQENGTKTTEVRPFVKMRNKENPIFEDTLEFAPWTQQDWINFATYTDFKSWVVKGLSDEGKLKVRASTGSESGDAKWAEEEYLAKDDAETVDRLKLSPDDARILKGNRYNMRARIQLAKGITQGTNLAESVRTAFDAEKDNMLEAIIVISDGKSNLGAEARAGDGKEKRTIHPELEKLHLLARGKVPIFTIGIGENRSGKVKVVRITSLQAPDQTPPDDAFKILVEVDGENMSGETKDVVLELYPEDSDTPFEIAGKVTFDNSEPPHGQFEATINPADLNDKIPEDLRSKVLNGKMLVEGKWKARARMKKVGEDGKDDPKELVFSESTPIQEIKKPVRVLLMCGAPNRDFQFLLTQLIRDKADLSVYVQNEAGQFIGDKSITFLDDKFRHLKSFPNRLLVEDDPSETPESRWLNLARYDVIIAFDADWSLLTKEQAEQIRTWVDLQAGGLLQVAGPVNTKKLTYVENAEKLEPLLSVMPVIFGDYDLKMSGRERREPRRLEFPGASPEMEFLRLDDDKPDEVISGWEPFFTGKETAEEGARATVKRGFYDYYPVKDVKAGATIVARYVEPQAAENTFDKKDPPYIVTFKYGQGWTAFLGSSEVWRFNQYKGVYFQRFWVKMSRFLSSGSRKRQNVRGRILMSKEFSIGDYFRETSHLLGPDLKGIPASAQPEIILRPVELDSYAGMTDGKKKDAPAPKKEDGDPDKLTREKEDYHKRLTRVYKMGARKGQDQTDEGYFEFKKMLTAKEFPTGIWRIDVAIPNSSESLTQKFLIRKSPPLELADTTPDFLSLAAISSEIDEVKQRLDGKRKSNVYERLSARAFQRRGWASRE